MHQPNRREEWCPLAGSFIQAEKNDWQNRLVCHDSHLVGSVCVVSEQCLSIRVNEVFEFVSEEIADHSRFLGL
jgi:hypothetical protein